MTEQKKRLTYLMLFRIGVVTLLLGATFLSELAAVSTEPVAPRTNALLGLIAVTYLFTIVFAVLLQRARSDGAVLQMAAVQSGVDLLLTTALVHLTGGVDSGFAFMYLLVIVSASFVLGRTALWTAAGAVVLYGAALALRRFLPLLGQSTASPPLRDVLRAATVNSVAFVATGVLGARLAVELRSAGERIATQGARLRDLAALHKDVIRCLTSGLVTITREGTVITYNIAAAEILGIAAMDAVGQPIERVMPALPGLLKSLPENAPLRRSEISQRCADGLVRTLGVSLSPLVDSEGHVLGRILSFQDLTELRRMEEVVSRSERLAAIGRLAAGVAHEIRNPLAAISGSVELLAQSPGTDADQKQLMDIVTREVTRLNSLISDLLDFARPRAPDPQLLDLSATVAEMLKVFEHDKRLDGSRVQLKTNGAVTIEADPGQLRQVVWNLVRNACEADETNGPVDVEVGTVDADGGRWARLAVRDRGPGISEEHRSRMFEPFFSTKQGGTGLGLATVHRIVEEHRGKVMATVPSDGGARFEVLLPLQS
jgi:two-component system sensor histidine kinase PilS (NtrC family)